MKVRARLRLRNDAMISARERLGLSQNAVDARAGVAAHTTHRFEKMDLKTRDPEKILANAGKVADVLGIRVEDVCPAELIGVAIPIPNDRVVDIPTVSLLDMAREFQRRLTIESPDVDLEKREEVEQLLARVTDAQRAAIEYEYLGGEEYAGAHGRGVGRNASGSACRTGIDAIRTKLGLPKRSEEA